jgi:hypothetical protein
VGAQKIDVGGLWGMRHGAGNAPGMAVLLN